jgi:cation diffusion facilitator family transporter
MVAATVHDVRREKSMVALSSVGAALGLTSMKLVVGLVTGSLGILAEAAHSGLDLVAALMTLFAVRVASRPADATHHYGHGKVENLSAFLEAGLLLLTAVWVIYEAVRRLLFHEGHVEVTVWAFLVMAISITVDFTRSRALLRIAHRTGSQALEADGLHFRTDIWSSAVVILGLGVVWLSVTFHLPVWLGQADAVAALGVSGIVIWVSVQLARETVDALLDRAPDAVATAVVARIGEVEGVLAVRRVRVRRAGNKFFADATVAAPRTFTFAQTHTLTERVEQAARDAVHAEAPQAEVDLVVHVEPTAAPDETVGELIQQVAQNQGVYVHAIHVREVQGALEADVDVEVPAHLDVGAAHARAARLEEAVLAEQPHLRRVTTHLEARSDSVVPREEVTGRYGNLVEQVRQLADQIAGAGATHEIHLYQAQATSGVDGAEQTAAQAGAPLAEQRAPRGARGSLPALDLVLHITVAAEVPLSEVHLQAEKIKRALRDAYPTVEAITIHTEPPGQ